MTQSDLNYVEDSAGGPDVTVGILPKLDKVTLVQVCYDIRTWTAYPLSGHMEAISPFALIRSIFFMEMML